MNSVFLIPFLLRLRHDRRIPCECGHGLELEQIAEVAAVDLFLDLRILAHLSRALFFVKYIYSVALFAPNLAV